LPEGRGGYVTPAQAGGQAAKHVSDQNGVEGIDMYCIGNGRHIRAGEGDH